MIAVGRGRQRLLRRVRAVAVAQRQPVHRHAHRRAVHVEIGLGPLPAVEAMHRRADHEAARMRFLRQPRQRQRLAGLRPTSAAIAPARVLGLRCAAIAAACVAPQIARAAGHSPWRKTMRAASWVVCVK